MIGWLLIVREREESRITPRFFCSNNEGNGVIFSDLEKTTGRVIWGCEGILRIVFWKSLRSISNIVEELSETLDIGIWH